MSSQIKNFVYGASKAVDAVKARDVRAALDAKASGSPMSLSLLVGRFGDEVGRYIHSLESAKTVMVLAYVDSLMP